MHSRGSLAGKLFLRSAACGGPAGREPGFCAGPTRGGLRETGGGWASDKSTRDFGSCNTRLLGSHQSAAFFWNCGDSRDGLCVYAQFPGARQTGNFASRRRGQQLGWIRQPGGSGDYDFRGYLLLVASHWPSQTGTLDVDWPHRRDSFWRYPQLFAGIAASSAMTGAGCLGGDAARLR
jgi:hypothetical protein